MKKLSKVVLSLLITMVLFGSLIVPIYADTDTKTPLEPAGLSIKVESGYGGEYKIGYYCPFTITIDNNYKDFSGEIQLKLPNDYMTDNLYAIKADIPKGTKETFKVDLPIFNYLTRVKLILAEGKDQVYEKNITIKPGVNAEMLLLGVVSDNNENLGYFSSIYDASGMLQPIKIVRLDEKNFPESDLALRAFNGLIINDFDTSKLNSKQYEALKNSVRAGTGLLVGTGGFSAKTFGLFTDDFIKGKVGTVRKVQTTGISDIGKVKSSFPLSMEIADIEIDGATAIPEQDGLKLIQEKVAGKGKILVAAFDLGNKDINNWSERASFSNEILKELFDARMKSMNQGNPGQGLSTPYYLENFLRNIPEIPRPNFGLIMGLLALYIVLVGPVTYIVLKKMDKRELMWFVAPAMGILFAFVLFFAGSSSRISEPIINYVNIIETEADGNAMISTFASVFSPDRRDLSVTGGSKSKLIPMLNANYDPSMNMDAKDRKIAAKIIVGEKSLIEYKENGIGITRILSIDGSRSVSSGLKCEINRSSGDFRGTITNQTGMDLEGVVILFKNSFIKIEKLKAGEVHIIKEKQNKAYSDYWQMLNEIYPDPYSIKKSVASMKDDEILKIRTDFQRRQIIEGYSQTAGLSSKAKIFAFGSSPLAPQIQINGKQAKAYEKTVVISEAEVSYRNGNSVFIPAGIILPQLKPANINSGINLNPDAGFLYGNGGDAEIFYELDKKTKVTELVMTAIGNNGVTSGKPMPPGTSTGTFEEFIWDYKAQSWVKTSANAVTYKGEDLSRFLGDSNILRLKFAALNGEVQVPQISMKGTVK